MKSFNNQYRSPHQAGDSRSRVFFTTFLLVLFAMLWAGQGKTYAQACTTPAPSVLAKWDFNSKPNQTVCSLGQGQTTTNTWFRFNQGLYTYCPSTSTGCAKSIIGSDGATNTGNFYGALCLVNFYNLREASKLVGTKYDPNSSVWDPTGKANFFVTYDIPAGRTGCITNFSLSILQKQFNGTINFEKQGVTVYRDGVQIYSTVQNILASHINGTMTFNFPNTSDFCTDGSKQVKFKIVFGLVKQLRPPAMVGTVTISPDQVGYDDIAISGICSASKIPTASTTKATCSATGANSNGKITIANFDTGNKFAYTEGATYTGSATFASGSTAIPTDGVIVSNLADPATAKQYTVRVFSATCYRDLTVTLNPSGCPTPCVPPAATLTPTNATCNGSVANDDAQIAITGISNGDKIGIAEGGTYTGADYATAQAIAGGAYTFTNLGNPATAEVYTIRVFNGSNTCFKDFTTTINPASCTTTCTSPSGIVLTPTLATCTGSTANDDAEIAVTGVSAGDKVGIWAGTSYTGAGYVDAATLTSSGAYTFVELENPASPQVYTIRVFNGANSCYTDRTVILSPKTCTVACTQPTATISATKATCAGSIANDDASINITGISNGDKIEIVAGSTYTGNNYAGATLISGGAFSLANLENPATTQVFTIRIFNGSDACFKDFTTTLDPVNCTPSCTLPTGTVLTPTLATCTGSTPNNDARIAVSGVTGGNKVGISMGSTYTGADYTTAQTLSSGAYTFTALNNPTASQIYTVRVFNASNTCFSDHTVMLEPKDCPCVKPTATVAVTRATCSGTTANNNASIAITGVTNGNRVGMSVGATYTGAAYATAQALSGGAYTFSGLNNPASSQIYTIRVFNTSDACYTDFNTTLDPTNCAPSCTFPSGIVVTPTLATCTGSLANNNASIAVAGVSNGNKVGLSTGSTYTGADYSTAQTLTSGAYTFSNLSNPTLSQVYTIRVFNANNTCYTDNTITLLEKDCPCTPPTGMIITPTQATCNGTVSNNNASIAITGVTGGTKVGISAGSTYTGVSYATAQILTGGAYTFSGLNNPSVSQTYTLRTFLDAGCFIDRQISIDEKECGPCRTGCSEIIESGAIDFDSNPDNGLATEDDRVCIQACTGTGTIDLKLSQTVSPSSGSTCGSTGTSFVWTTTIQNEGTITATDIRVRNIIPDGLSQVNAVSSIGTIDAGWVIPSLAAGALATLTVTTRALVAGTFKYTVEVTEVSPSNDPDSTPDNGITTEDDYAEATITVVGANAPSIVKEFSPMYTKPNTPIRLILKITNNESTPVTLTNDLVDTLSTAPAAMVIAATPYLSTSGLVFPPVGITATAGAGSITIPKGTVLIPGLNQLAIDVTAPSNGYYCEDIAVGALQTTAGSNCLAAEACVMLNNTFEVAPIVNKTMLPATIQTGQNAVLTITIENKNVSAMTLNQEFVDILPANLVATGTVTSSCGGASLREGNTEIVLAAGTSIAANSTCTISVNVTSDTAGTYCNRLAMNSVLTTVGTNNNLGNEDYAVACITVTANPCTAVDISGITASPASGIKVGNSVTITPIITGSNTKTIFQWSVSPTTGSSFDFNAAGNTTTWKPTVAGNYTLKLLADNTLNGPGTCKDSITVSLMASSLCDKPVAVVVPKVQTICAGSTASAYTATPDTGVEYKWYGPLADTTSSLGTGISGQTLASFTPSGTALTTAGTKYYAVIVNNTGDIACADTAFVKLVVNAKPNAGNDQNLACANATTNILTTSTTLVPVTAGGTFAQIGTTPALATISGNAVSAMTVAGTYQFQYSVVGCLDTVAVIVQPCTGCVKPNAGADAAAVCQPVTTAKLTAVTTGGTWAAQAGNPATATIDNNGNISGLSTAGTYKFIYSVTGGGTTCTDTAQVVVNAKPTIADGVATICAGESVDLTSKITGYATYLSPVWTVATAGGTAVATPTAVKPTATTTYVLVAQNASGCKDTTNVVVTVNPKPIIADGSATICAGENVDLTSKIANYSTYLSPVWTVATAGGTAVTTATSVKSTVTTTYVLVAQNATGCKDTANVVVTVNPKPNAGADQTLSCANATTNTLTTSTTLVPVTVGGMYTQIGTTPAIATITSNVVSGMTVAGTYQFVYTLNGCKDTIAVMVQSCAGCVKPNAGPDQTLTCPATGIIPTTVNLEPVTVGGVWTGITGNPSITTITGNKVTGISNDGTYKYIYTITSGGETCTDTVEVIKPRCVQSKGSLGGYVWKDLNQNGIQDEVVNSGLQLVLPQFNIVDSSINVPKFTNAINHFGTGVLGIQVELYTVGNPIAIGRDTTNSDGEYLFPNLEAGIYYIKILKESIPVDCRVSSLRDVNTGEGTDKTDSDVDPITGQSGNYVIDPTDSTKKDIFSVDVALNYWCSKPTLTLGGTVCTGNGMYNISFNVSGGSITSSAGTVSGNTIMGIPIGTNVVVTASTGVGCSTVLTAQSPSDCSPGNNCALPLLGVGQPICNGITYSVAFNVINGSVRTSAGVISGNAVVGIPVGTDVIITAYNSATCTSKVEVKSPTDCNTPCVNADVSVSLPVCEVAGGSTYKVNYLTTTGTVVTSNVGAVGTETITGIPSGASIVLTVKRAGCSDKTVTLMSKVCPDCVKPSFRVITPTQCSSDNSTYSVVLEISGKLGLTPKFSTGVVTGNNPYIISGIPNGTNLRITDSLNSVCKFDTTIVSQNCNCSPKLPILLTPSMTACAGDTFPTIKATVIGLATVEWFTQATGGAAVFTGLNYKPSGTIPTTGAAFYAQARSTDPTCPTAVSMSRVMATINAQDCTKEVDLALKKSINTKIAQIGDVLTYTIKVWNESNKNATGLEVSDSIATTVQFQTGSFTASRGSASITGNVIKWTIGNIAAAGDTVTLTYQVKATQEGIHFNTAEISKVNEKDKDSTPGNGKDNEDDIDNQCFTVPVKLCAGEKVQASVPANLTNVQWFKNGSTTSVATGNTVLLTEVGTYTFTATNQTCPANGCCPIIIEPGINCCPEDLCIPFTIKKRKK